MVHRLVKALWGNLKGEELKKFTLLAFGFFALIGSYWPLKILKDVIFIDIVGSRYQPYAKFASLALFFPLVLFYSKLVDHFSKEKLIYVLLSLYGGVGLLFVYFFYHPTIGLENPEQSPYRLLGWGFFLFVESYISLLVSLYWAFIHDITTPDSAKRGYGFLIFGSQLGAVVFILLGNYLSRDITQYVTRAPLIALISILMFSLVAIVVFVLKHFVSGEEMTGYKGKKEVCNKKESVGFWEGLRVLIRCPYVGGIFGLVFFHEVISALMHYQMLRSVELTYLSSRGLVNKFMFDFYIVMQTISCLFALFGTSYFQRKFGVRGCLIGYPLLLAFGVILYILHPTLGFITGVMIVAKGINYVLNQPAKEMLYIPTTKAVKYKAKAWIDMFGMRFAKGTGSLVNTTIGLAARLTGGVSLILVVLWVALSRFLGTYHYRVLQKGERIGEKKCEE